MKKQSQAGFAVVELAVIVVVLAGLGGISYFVWSQHQDKNKHTPTVSSVTAPAVASQSTSPSTPTAPQVNSASDLNSAAQALDQTDTSASNSDSSQLSSQASGF